MDKMVSLITPAYNEADMIGIAYKEIRQVIDDLGVECEFIYIDDGSKDGTFDEVK